MCNEVGGDPRADLPGRTDHESLHDASTSESPTRGGRPRAINDS